jgi:hypothetical protein
MEVWPEDAPERQRRCPFREPCGCAATFDSYRQLLTHCRQQHPDTPPRAGDPTPALVMTDARGRALSWEEIQRLVEHPFFWRRPHGVVLPGEEGACR